MCKIQHPLFRAYHGKVAPPVPRTPMQAEAAVMKIVEGTSGTYPSRRSSGVSTTEIPKPGTQGRDVPAQPRDTRARTVERRTEALSGLPLPDGKREEPTDAGKGKTSIDAGASGDENDLHTVDRILEEALGGAQVGAKGLEATRLAKATDGGELKEPRRFTCALKARLLHKCLLLCGHYEVFQ